MDCENHPDERAVATCIACGASICEECVRRVNSDVYCFSCAEDLSPEYDDEEEEDELAEEDDDRRAYGY